MTKDTQFGHTEWENVDSLVSERDGKSKSGRQSGQNRQNSTSDVLVGGQERRCQH